MELDKKTISILVLVASSISGVTGTYAGGAKAEERVKQLEGKVQAISEKQVQVMTKQEVILKEIDKLQTSADTAQVDRVNQDKKLTEIITILSERDRRERAREMQ